MRFILATLLLTFSLSANASHHRGHAIALLEQMDQHFKIILWQMDQYESKCDLDAYQQRQVDVVRGYSSRLITWLPYFRNDMISGDLETMRRKFSQPNPSGMQSVSSIMSATLHHARQLVGKCPAGDADLSGAIARISWAWALIDQVVWHVDDAIREEVYMDPVFICSGPNNHC